MAAFLELRRNADLILVELELLAKYYFNFILYIYLSKFIEKPNMLENSKIEVL